MIQTQFVRYGMFTAACAVIGVVAIAPRLARVVLAQQAAPTRGATVVETSLFIDDDATGDDSIVAIEQPRESDSEGKPASMRPPASAVRDSAYAKTRAALEQPTAIDFFDEPLLDAMAHLESLHNVQLHIDQLKLDEIGITTDTPITIEIEDVSLRSALKLMLRPLGLVFTFRDEVLTVTTPDEATTNTVTRVYAVDDTLPLDAEAIVNMIFKHVAPRSWSEVGGEAVISGYPGGVVISQTPEAHEEIEDLLSRLCKSRTQRGSSTPPSSSTK